MGGSPNPRGLEGAGWGSNKEPLLPRSRQAGSRPSCSPQSRGGAGRQGGVRLAPRLPSPRAAPSPPGKEGRGRRLRVPPPRAPPPLGLPAAAIPTLLPRLPQLPVAHGLGGGRGPGERRPGARPRRHPWEGSRGSSRRRRRPRDPLGLSAPSQPFFRPLLSYSRPAPRLCARRWCSLLAVPRSRRPLVSCLPAASPPLEDGPLDSAPPASPGCWGSLGAAGTMR